MKMKRLKGCHGVPQAATSCHVEPWDLSCLGWAAASGRLSANGPGQTLGLPGSVFWVFGECGFAEQGGHTGGVER